MSRAGGYFIVDFEYRLPGTNQTASYPGMYEYLRMHTMYDKQPLACGLTTFGGVKIHDREARLAIDGDNFIIRIFQQSGTSLQNINIAPDDTVTRT